MRSYLLSGRHCFAGHKNNVTIEFFCKRVNATVLIKPFNLTALVINVRFHVGLCLNGATSRENARSVHAAECAADAIVTSGSASPDPSL